MNREIEMFITKLKEDISVGLHRARSAREFISEKKFLEIQKKLKDFEELEICRRNLHGD
jgi:hypothetical protein